MKSPFSRKRANEAPAAQRTGVQRRGTALHRGERATKGVGRQDCGGWSIRLKWLVFTSLAVAACASPTDSGPWEMRRAEELRANGRVDAALRRTDRAIALDSQSPTRELVALHIELLEENGRHIEAESLNEFSTRYFAGEQTERVGEELAQRDCGGRQPGLKLVHSWAKPEKGFWAIGVIVATFEIDQQGRIGQLVVHSARDPASAWGAIDAITRARVRDRRVKEFHAKEPNQFPVALCLWRNFDPRQDPIPRDGTIRGSG